MASSSSPSDLSAAGVFRRLGAAGPVAVMLSFSPPIFSLLLLARLTEVGPWLQGRGLDGWLIYFVLAGLLMGVSLLPTYACAILAGWAFGFAAGFPLAMATITVAAVIAYVIGRWIARDRVIDVIRERPRWRAVHEALLGSDRVRTRFVVTLLRIPPSSPFALANFCLAAARVPLVDYTLGTLVGVAPRTALAAFAAAGLKELTFKNVGNAGWVIAAGIVATLVVCMILGLMANRALQQVTGEEG
jgi:uncharacterized membrane protein YdjX (TVP38/TMEM64 family)